MWSSIYGTWQQRLRGVLSQTLCTIDDWSSATVIVALQHSGVAQGGLKLCDVHGDWVDEQSF